MIHVCFCQYDKTGLYSKFTGTAMCSIFKNSANPPRSIMIHILHDNTLTPDNRDKFIYLTGQYRQLVKFYNVEELCKEQIAKINRFFPRVAVTRYTIGMFYRFFIPQLLSSDIKKAIYLDSDTIVNLDIAELWRIDLGDKPLGAINEVCIASNPLKNAVDKYLEQIGLVEYEDYFNSGVLMMNLEYWRNNEEYIMTGFNFASLHTEMVYVDQDILNYLFSKNYVKLPKKYDVFVIEARKTNEVYPAIYHYIDITLKPAINDPFNKLWMNYFTKTPWFDIHTIYNLYNSISEFGEARRNLFIEISAAMSGRKRVFVVNEKVDWLKKVYFIQKEEEIFICKDKQTLPKLIEEMKASRDTKIFFIRDWNLIKPLKQAGFVEGKDFFNHYELFSPNLLSNIDANTLIKKM